MKLNFLTAGIFALSATVAGCSAQPAVDVVDLNKVLDAFATVISELQPSSELANSDSPSSADAAATGAAEAGQIVAESAAGEATKVPAIASAGKTLDPASEKEFLDRYAAKLNEVKAMHADVGVAMQASGEIIGFKDPNGNNIQDSGETKEFTVTLDPENNRLVAADNNGNYRPHSYFPGGGFMMGYLMSSMLGRQNSFFSGANSGARPNFNNTPMSSADYHKSAVNSARSSARASAAPAARARTGSRGFSFGK